MRTIPFQKKPVKTTEINIVNACIKKTALRPFSFSGAQDCFIFALLNCPHAIQAYATA